MTRESLDCLYRHYERLRTKLQASEKISDSCVLLELLGYKSNERYRLLIDYSISEKSVPQSVIQELRSMQMIRESDVLGAYVLTARGIWLIDKERGSKDADLIDGIDKKYLDLFSTAKKLASKEKAILLLLIALRSFSEGSALDLKQSDVALNHIQDILLLSHGFLSSQGIIPPEDSGGLLVKKGNEHPVSNAIRHTDSLPKKTNGLYKAIGKQKYFINIYREDQIQAGDLAWVLWKIFGTKLSEALLSQLISFCEKHAYDKGIYVFSDLSKSFINPRYDDYLAKSYSEYLEHLSNWKA